MDTIIVRPIYDEVACLKYSKLVDDWFKAEDERIERRSKSDKKVLAEIKSNYIQTFLKDI